MKKNRDVDVGCAVSKKADPTLLYATDHVLHVLCHCHRSCGIQTSRSKVLDIFVEHGIVW